MARYSIGEVLTTIQFKTRYDLDTFSFDRYEFFTDDTKKMYKPQFEIIQLTVTEHHKVSSQWDTENNLDYDGFKLVDSRNLVWHNQFPKASYGQVTDTQDQIFKRIDKLPEEKDDPIHLNYPAKTRLVTDYLDFLKRNVNRFDFEQSKRYCDLFERIEQKLLNNFNLVLKEEPSFPDEPKCKDIAHFVLVKKD